MAEARRERAVAVSCALVLVMTLFVSAAPPAGASSVRPAVASAPPPVLRIGFLRTVDSLSPFLGVNEPSLVLYGLLYDFPFSFDQDGNLVPNLVTSASCAVADCAVWNYTVRQGVEWSDGTNLTAADVNFTWNYDSQNFARVWAYEPYFNHVVGCAAATEPDCGAVRSSTNPWNVTVYFDRPFAAGEDLMAPIVEQRQWSGVSPGSVNSYANPTPIGTGPFIADPNLYTEWQQGGAVPLHLLRNPHYHPVGNVTPNTAITDVYLSTYSSASAMANALTAGDLDLAEFMPATVGTAAGLANVQVQAALQAIQAWNYLGISQCDNSVADGTLNPARWDVNVRQALARATDKDYIVQSIYGGQGVRGDSLMSPITPNWWYDPVAGSDNLSFNLARAHQILNESGYPTWSGGSFGNGVREATNAIAVSIQSSSGAFRVENLTNVTKTIPAGTALAFTLAVRPPAVFPDDWLAAMYLQREWAKIGVQLTLKQESTEAGLATDVYSCKVELYLWVWSSNPDPNYMLSMQSSWTLDGWNDNYWVNTSYNRLYLAELGDRSPAQRQTDVRAAEQIQYEAAPFLITLYPYGEWAMRTDLWQGWGNWTAHPYRQMNVPWGANPLWFNLTCPTCSPAPLPPAPTAPQVAPSGNISAFSRISVALTSSSSDADASVQLNFTSTWGDGNATTAVTSAASPTTTSSHAWATPGTYSVNVTVYDGYNAPVWAPQPVVADVVAPSNVGWLAGTVTDTSGHPLPAAVLEATPGNWVNASTTAGTYNLSLPAGTYSLTASAPYATPVTVANVVVASGDATTEDFALSLTPSWINGTVVDAASGLPVAGATIHATSGNGYAVAGSTNPGGAFNLTLEPGTYTVAVSASGYMPASTAGVVAVGNRATPLTVDLFPAANPIQIVLNSTMGPLAQSIQINGTLTTPGAGTWELDFGNGDNVSGTHGAGTTAIRVGEAFSAEGAYTMRLTATSGLVSSNVTATVLVDGTPPVTQASVSGIGGGGGWYRSPVTVSLMSTDALSGVAGTWYTLDAGVPHVYNGSFVISAEGLHTILYDAVDRVGNREPVQTLTLGVDTTPPQVGISTPGPAATLSSSRVTLSWTGNDNVSGIASYEVRVDGGPWQRVGTNTSLVIRLPDGAHTVTVRGFDAAGNNATASVTFRVDTNPFSPTGPYGGLPTYGIAVAAAAAVAGFALWRRRKRSQGPPAPPVQP